MNIKTDENVISVMTATTSDWLLMCISCVYLITTIISDNRLSCVKVLVINIMTAFRTLVIKQPLPNICNV